MATRRVAGLAGVMIWMASAMAVAEPARDPALDERIGYWTSEYTGAELGSCDQPRVPGMSRTNGEIRALGRAINAWQRCHDALTERLRAPATLEERVEPAVLAAMSAEEREAAQRHIEAAHAQRLRVAEAEAAAANKWHRDWLTATADYVAAENAGQKASRQIVARNSESARRFRKDEHEQQRKLVEDRGF